MNSPGSVLDKAALGVLAEAGSQIVELNLQDAGLDDDGLAALGELGAVTELRLSPQQDHRSRRRRARAASEA